jgi:hypothetical protein
MIVFFPDGFGSAFGATGFGASFFLLARFAALPALLNDFNFDLLGRLVTALFTSLFLLEDVFFLAADFFADMALASKTLTTSRRLYRRVEGAEGLKRHPSASGKAIGAGGRHRGCLCSATTVV